jgi:hypothetical protein
MVQTFAEVLMGADVGAVCGAACRWRAQRRADECAYWLPAAGVSINLTSRRTCVTQATITKT